MIRVVTTLKCNTCPAIASEQIGKTDMVEFVRMVANEKGWITADKHGLEVHICPVCQEIIDG